MLGCVFSTDIEQVKGLHFFNVYIPLIINLIFYITVTVFKIIPTYFRLISFLINIYLIYFYKNLEDLKLAATGQHVLLFVRVILPLHCNGVQEPFSYTYIYLFNQEHALLR